MRCVVVHGSQDDDCISGGRTNQPESSNAPCARGWGNRAGGRRRPLGPGRIGPLDWSPPRANVSARWQHKRLGRSGVRVRPRRRARTMDQIASPLRPPRGARCFISARCANADKRTTCNQDRADRRDARRSMQAAWRRLLGVIIMHWSAMPARHASRRHGERILERCAPVERWRLGGGGGAAPRRRRCSAIPAPASQTMPMAGQRTRLPRHTCGTEVDSAMARSRDAGGGR